MPMANSLGPGCNCCGSPATTCPHRITWQEPCASFTGTVGTPDQYGHTGWAPFYKVKGYTSGGTAAGQPPNNTVGFSTAGNNSVTMTGVNTALIYTGDVTTQLGPLPCDGSDVVAGVPGITSAIYTIICALPANAHVEFGNEFDSNGRAIPVSIRTCIGDCNFTYGVSPFDGSYRFSYNYKLQSNGQTVTGTINNATRLITPFSAAITLPIGVTSGTMDITMPAGILGTLPSGATTYAPNQIVQHYEFCINFCDGPRQYGRNGSRAGGPLGFMASYFPLAASFNCPPPTMMAPAPAAAGNISQAETGDCGCGG